MKDKRRALRDRRTRRGARTPTDNNANAPCQIHAHQRPHPNQPAGVRACVRVQVFLLYIATKQEKARKRKRKGHVGGGGGRRQRKKKDDG